MKKKAIILPVETKSREFHGKLLLSLHLLHEGFPVLLGDQERLWEHCDLVEPGIYIDKSVASTHAAWIRRCRALGHEVVSWDEEGLIFFEPWMYRRLRIDPKSMDGVSRFFAWGPVHRDAICEEYPQYLAKIIPCGNPRFDLLRQDRREFYRPTVDALKRRFGRMIQVNTNFALHNHFRPANQVRKMLASYPLANEPGYIDGWIAMHRHAHEAYLEMVPQLLARFPEHAIVVRPHPSENQAPWRELAEKHPRLHVDASGNVHEWILASEAVIHFNCTTAVEAFLLGVPPIAYRPGRYPRYENPLPYALSENTFSLEELWTALAGRETARARGVLWTDEQNREAERYITGLTGKSASERIVSELSALNDNLPPARTAASHRLLNRAKHAWRERLHAWRERHNPADGYSAQKFPGITADELRADLSRISAVTGLHARCRIRPFGKNCHWLLPGGR